MIRMLLVGYCFASAQSGVYARGASQFGVSLFLQRRAMADCRVEGDLTVYLLAPAVSWPKDNAGNLFPRMFCNLVCA
jgi:hypothetical protein